MRRAPARCRRASCTGWAYAHRERLGASIAGFTEAVNWPFPEETLQG
jgi:hypothetical protein